ncbi:MAG: hypothetical protein E7004_04550 [Alphaproteobacteria bacterium]|nr:hypothetical protein [Alphaproteobacteria bacterium]
MKKHLYWISFLPAAAYWLAGLFGFAESEFFSWLGSYIGGGLLLTGSWGIFCVWWFTYNSRKEERARLRKEQEQKEEQ